MKIAIYTSFATNYLAKARVLVDSVKALNPDVHVVGLVNDRLPHDIRPESEAFDELWFVDDYPAKRIRPWIFRHNIMELSTAVKGWALVRLLEAGFDYVMYIDPDGWMMVDPRNIIDVLPADKSVAVVPHTTRPADSDEEIRLIETSSLRHGIYNLGFLLVRNDADGMKLARWWAARLDRYCIDDFEQGLFTDQRWFDLAVGYFDFIHVSRHPGIDVASWNVGQRSLERVGDKYLIDGEPMLFYHFSGVGPAGVHRWVREQFAPADPLVSELEFRYEALIDEKGQQTLARVKPFFDFYDDGTPVHIADRKLFRTRPDLADRFEDPYATGDADSFKAIAIAHRPQVSADGTPADTLPAFGSPEDMEIESRARALFESDIYRKSVGTDVTDEDSLWASYMADPWNLNLRFNRFFDQVYYCQGLTDEERACYPSPLHHYICRGIEAGLSPNWIYDDGYYLRRYPDIAAAIRSRVIGSGFEHFSRFGWREGKVSSAFFDESAYLRNNPDVAAAVSVGIFLNGEQHYIEFGRKEGRAV